MTDPTPTSELIAALRDMVKFCADEFADIVSDSADRLEQQEKLASDLICENQGLKMKIDALEEWQTRAIEVLKKAEWSSHIWPGCPLCSECIRYEPPHHPDCEWMALLSTATPTPSSEEV